MIIFSLVYIRCTDSPSLGVSGNVMDAVTGLPLEGVKVMFENGSDSDVTDAGGQFNLTIDEGGYAGLAIVDIEGEKYLQPDSLSENIGLHCVAEGYQLAEYRVVSDITGLTISMIPEPGQVPAEGYTGDHIPGTALLDHDVAWENIIDGVRAFHEKRIDRIKPFRAMYWDRDSSSPDAYIESVATNRTHFRTILGAIDERKTAALDTLAMVSETADYSIYEVRWPVFKEVKPGPALQDWPTLDVPREVFGEGLLLQPKGEILGYTIAIPDADQDPEDMAGLNDSLPLQSQFGRRLVENGLAVVVPVILDRTDRWSRNTNRPSRTWIYSQGHEMGRTIAGYEVQKMEALVDWFSKVAQEEVPIGIAGYGEGGLLAFYTAALDTRIQSTLVSGYFAPREEIWKEPIYRNVWGLLKEFGDAELASLIAPRSLVVEYSEVPDYKGPRAHGRQVEPPGELWTHDFSQVESEFQRIDSLTGLGVRKLVSGPAGNPVSLGSEEAIAAFALELGLEDLGDLSSNLPVDQRTNFDPEARMGRMVEQMTGHTQLLLRDSEYKRNEFVKQFQSQEEAREFFNRELIGWLDEDFVPMNVRTKVFEEQKDYMGYDVLMDVLPDVSLWGILLIPKGIPAGEKRPVVVLQHGRGGNPTTALKEGPTYYAIGRKLAQQGFIVFTPFGNWTGETRFRWIDRIAKPAKATLWSAVGREHQQLIRWLKTLPIVDRDNIGFYGKSIGGQAASLIASMLPEYAMTINCAYFNESARKESSIYFPTSFVYHVDSEMPMWNRGHTIEYAEMSNLLIFPRPFMVEHGKQDGIAPPGWVEYEYAKVREFYEAHGKGNLTILDHHDGGHIINEVISVPFLITHLDLN